ncbi:MAG: hypothetical protein M1819_001340 [Sarea resinae]|nr:MAG: hypothetical protein M1819_001340 [Sarea resinae]
MADHESPTPSVGEDIRKEARSPRMHTDGAALPTDSLVTVRLSDPDPLREIVQTPEKTAPATALTGDEAQNEETSDGEMDRQSLETTTPAVVHDELKGTKTRTPEASFDEDDSEIIALDDVPLESYSGDVRSRSDSSSTQSTEGSTKVDWEELDKSEEQAPRDSGSDESTAFLLARLEQENNALATDPKSGIKATRSRSESRPPSIHHLKRLVKEPTAPSLRFSILPDPPPMTELEFWAALVKDYPQTAQRLPTLTSNKVRAGIPPPLRGVVWMSLAGARDRLLEEQYDRLLGESSPYENMIGKDIGRSFPGVEMFRDPEGEGQQMLGRVLKCFSLYDHKIGYCQGLGFLVGPLLMQMGDKEAFCVLVRLMEHYDLRSCFLPDLSGLHLRIYQFQHLLAQHLPKLSAHLENHQVEPAYVSQWFLSFFAVTCPLPMLLRIYDVILAEGASETIMRVALSLMRRNEKKILACAEFEDVMQFLLSRSLWDTYGCNPDNLVTDFVGLTGLVSREGLQSLEASFKDAQREGSGAKIGSLPDLQAAASRFLGRIWAGSNSSTKSVTLSPGLTAPSRPSSYLLRRSPSKQSLASTLNSYEGASEASSSTVPTDVTGMSRQSSADCSSLKSNSESDMPPVTPRHIAPNKDKDLHGQIEDLLMALSEMQRDQSNLANELQKEREEREEDRKLARVLMERLRHTASLEAVEEQDESQRPTSNSDDGVAGHENAQGFSDMLDRAEERFTTPADQRRSSVMQSKHQLRDELTRSRERLEQEAARSQELTRQIEQQDQETNQIRDQLKDARSRLKESHREVQRLQHGIQELKARKPSLASIDSSRDIPTSTTVSDAAEARSSVYGGLRELKLGRSDSSKRSPTSQNFSKRTSSLSTQSILATENHQPAPEDALLVELVNAKTAEAVARQELEEVKGKLDALRRMVNVAANSSAGSGGHRPSPSDSCIDRSNSAQSTSSASSLFSQAPKSAGLQKPPTPAATSSGGGFWAGWGKRSVSTSEGR